MTVNEYRPFSSQILDIIRHTQAEYTFRMAYDGEVRPGQFFEVSLPKVGEAPISVSGIRKGSIDFTIRRAGKVTGEIFEHGIGQCLFLRGPYGNGFDLSNYTHKELLIVAGGTGVSPVRGVVEHFVEHPGELKSFSLIAGFKTPDDILFREDFARWRSLINITLTVDHANGSTEYPEGLVTQYIPDLRFENASSAVAIVVGPPVMMHFSTKELLAIGLLPENIWVSYERKMCCGLGKCGHCRIGGTYVCLDGPVYRLTQTDGLMD